MFGVYMFLIGACLGSFYLVIGRRLPKNEKVVMDRSRCDNCGHQLGFWDLIPIASFLLLKGKCRYCRTKISILNPLVELIMGGLFLYAYLHYGICFDFFMFLIISSLLVIIYISDFSYYIILDSPLVASGILICILYLYYEGIKYTLMHLLSGGVLFLVMLLIKFLGDKIYKRESLGGGDIKLAFIMGLALSFRLGLCALILSCFLALPYSVLHLYLKKNNEVAFGPFLASSLFIVLVFAEKFSGLLDLIFVSL